MTRKPTPTTADQLCTDCKHFRAFGSICQRPLKNHFGMKVRVWNFAIEERKMLCGEEAKYFEPK